MLHDHEMVEFMIHRATRRVHSKLSSLDFRRADFEFLKDLVIRVVEWDKALEGRSTPKKSWLVFKDHLP